MAKNTSLIEYEECKLFKQWLDYQNMKYTHIVGEGNFPVQYHMKLQRVGFHKGVPDYMILVPNGICFVEMKRKRGGRIYPEQKEWVEALNKIEGVEAAICKGADEAIAFVSGILDS